MKKPSQLTLAAGGDASVVLHMHGNAYHGAIHWPPSQNKIRRDWRVSGQFGPNRFAQLRLQFGPSDQSIFAHMGYAEFDSCEKLPLVVPASEPEAAQQIAQTEAMVRLYAAGGCSLSTTTALFNAWLIATRSMIDLNRFVRLNVSTLDTLRLAYHKLGKPMPTDLLQKAQSLAQR